MLYAIVDNFDNIVNKLIEKQNKDKREYTKDAIKMNTFTNIPLNKN